MYMYTYTYIHKGNVGLEGILWVWGFLGDIVPRSETQRGKQNRKWGHIGLSGG